MAGHGELLAEAEVTRGIASASLGRNVEALRALEGAMPLAEEARDLFALVRALHMSSGVHLELGEFDAACLQAERGLELARREGHALQITALTDDLATIAFYAGDWDLAQQM